jgi:hypothetical protein
LLRVIHLSAVNQRTSAVLSGVTPRILKIGDQRLAREVG